MTEIFGFPLALFLIIAGLIVFVAAWVVHWLFLIIAVVLIVAGIYFFLSGAAPPI
jgi:hypothetical protein